MTATVWSATSWIALALALFALAFLWSAFGALRHARLLKLTGTLATALVLLALAAALGTLALATRGYQALTHETVAATVEVWPEGPKRFRVRVQTPQGTTKEFQLAGDEFYIDAHILKWKPFANVLGLHTAYELDRVTGRYRELGDERAAPRTVYGLAQEKPMDLFALRQRYGALAPLLDAEYGSATFVPADRPQRLEVRVSTSGLLIRPVERRQH
ncbi:MAG: hypothetical protein ACLGHO_05420 [Gammaproteobacteria bacterium]